MRCQATLRLPDGQLRTLGHGDTIGRLWSSSVLVDDPRISEAHALVSLRGHELKLLGLRGRFAIEGRPTSELVLRPGQQIELAQGLVLVVEEVDLPEEVLGLATEGMPLRVLPGTCALIADPTPALVPPSHPAAVAHVWAQPEGWRLRAVGGEPVFLEDGTEVEVAGRRWRAGLVRLRQGHQATTPDTSLHEPLRIVARFDSVHIFRPGRAPAVIVGLPARVISELVAFGGPVPWPMLVAELWPEGGSRKQLDMTLVRLRRKLRDFRIRADLVRADGAGVLELVLREQDVVDDQT